MQNNDIKISNDISISYDGPEEYAALWKDFAKKYVNAKDMGAAASEGLRRHRVFKLERFNDLVFKHEKIEDFLEKYGTPFDEFKGDIEDVATAISVSSREKEFRPLHKAAVSSLVGQWIRLEKDADLYKPVSLRDLPYDARDEVRKERQQFLEQKPARLPADVIFAANSEILKAACAEVWHKRQWWNRQALESRYDSAVGMMLSMHDVVYNSLFRFDNEKGAHFSSYFSTHLATFIRGLVSQECRDSVGEKQIWFAESKVVSLTDFDPNDLLKPENKALVGNAEEELLQLLNTHYVEFIIERAGLNPKEKKAVKMRYGLDPEEKEHKLAEIGQELDVTPERVRQVLSNAAEKIKKCHLQMQNDGQGTTKEDCSSTSPKVSDSNQLINGKVLSRVSTAETKKKIRSFFVDQSGQDISLERVAELAKLSNVVVLAVMGKTNLSTHFPNGPSKKTESKLINVLRVIGQEEKIEEFQKACEALRFSLRINGSEGRGSGGINR